MATLNSENYYSLEMDRVFFSVSQYKSFCKCEAATMAKLRGEYTEPITRALLIGSFVDCYFEGTLDRFMQEHQEIFTRKNQLRAEFRKANEMIARVVQDPLFMQFMSGEKQKIMTAELFDVPWKIKIDSFSEGICITDLKTAASFRTVPNYRYDIQGAVYQKIAELDGYGKLPFFLDIVTKEKIPNFDIFGIDQPTLDMSLREIENNMPRFIAIKNGEEEPTACGECPYCRMVKKARIRNYSELESKYGAVETI